MGVDIRRAAQVDVDLRAPLGGARAGVRGLTREGPRHDEVRGARQARVRGAARLALAAATTTAAESSSPRAHRIFIPPTPFTTRPRYARKRRMGHSSCAPQYLHLDVGKCNLRPRAGSALTRRGTA